MLAKLESLPEASGVYIFWARGKAIYIGKAINLKRRVESYFASRLAPKTKRMVCEADRLTFIQVTCELEALLLEAKLIKTHQPRYNFQAKDDKHPLYIQITKDEFPRILTARKIQEEDSNLAFFGPFPSSRNVYSVLRMLRRIFPYSDHRIGNRPCLYSHLGLCDPCPNLIQKSKSKKNNRLSQENRQKYKLKIKYMKNIKLIKSVLSGRINYLKKSLEKEMLAFSKEEKFEEATQIRNKIAKLQYITQARIPSEYFLENPNLAEDLRTKELKDLRRILIHNSKFKIQNLGRIECYDVAHLAGSFPTASMVTFIDGEPEKKYYRHFRIRQKKGQDDIASLKEVIRRRKKHLEDWGRPDIIIVDGGKAQVSAFWEMMAKVGIPVVGLAKRPARLPGGSETLVFPDLSLHPLPKGSALNLVQRIRDEAHRFAQRYHHHLVSKNMLHFKK